MVGNPQGAPNGIRGGEPAARKPCPPSNASRPFWWRTARAGPARSTSWWRSSIRSCAASPAGSSVAGGPEGALDTGSLVNEAYLKLVDQTRVGWQDRDHFFAIAARAMRQVIIDFARKRKRQKRGGGVRTETLDDREIAMQTQAEDLLALDELCRGWPP